MAWAGPLAKPETRKRVKGRRRRAEAKAVKAARAACVKRDGFCLASKVSACGGKSEWAHAEERRRSRTTGSKNPPEYRHDPAHSGMLCTKHHEQYDGKRLPMLDLDALCSTGWNGPLVAQEQGGKLVLIARV